MHDPQMNWKKNRQSKHAMLEGNEQTWYKPEMKTQSHNRITI